MELLVITALVALLAHALHRNHTRQPQPAPHLAGTTDLPDRDTERTRSELLSRTPAPHHP